MNALFGPIDAARHVIAGLAMIAGFAALVGGLVAQLRFPDFFTRLHGALAAPIAAAAILAGLAVEAWDVRLAVRLGLLALLLLILAPVRSYLLARAAHGAGLAPLTGRLREHKSAP